MTPPEAPLLAVRGLRIRYGPVLAVDSLDLDIQRGELFVLLGGSGSGKTTLLRAIAGFVRPEAGRIALDGADLAPLPPHRRPVNTMFQSYALFPHMTVARNIGFGLRQQGLPRPEIARRVAEMLDLVAHGGLRRPPPRGTIRRPAATRGAGPRPGAASRPAAAGRAVIGARPRAARADPPGTGAAAAQDRHQLYTGDARPGGGADHGAPHRRDARRPAGADRHPGGGLRAPATAGSSPSSWAPPTFSPPNGAAPAWCCPRSA